MNHLKYKLLFTTVVVLFVWALAADIPFSFKAGEVISAEQMNQNFAVLNDSKQNLITGTCAAGSSIRSIATDGTVTCEVDDIGSGGSSGVDALNGQTGAVTLQAGDNITIDDSVSGQIKISSLASSATPYTADETSLTLSGSTFSIKSAGVGTAQLASKSVIADKLAFPIDVTGSLGFVGFSVRNTNPTDGAIGLRGQSGDSVGLSITGPLGVLGESKLGIGVFGASKDAIGVWGKSETRAVVGTQGDTSCAGSYAVGGCATTGDGVIGRAISARGIAGSSSSGRAVEGVADSGIGVIGISNTRAVIGTQGVISCAGTYAVGGCAVTGNSAQFHGGSGGTGTCSYSGGAGWSCTSDRNAKENFKAINSKAILEQLASMPISTWNMKGDTALTPHLGPVAQDFHSAFGLGENDITINTADAQGVALAAIQGLYALVQEQQAKIAELEAQISSLR